MGKYRSRLLFLVTIGILSVFISVPVAGAGICKDTDPPFTCFTTPSGYVVRTADIIEGGITCADQLGNPVYNVTQFPQIIPDGWGNGVASKIWCYQLERDFSISTNKSISQINLQVAVPYFTTPDLPNIKMQPGGEVFQFNAMNGCLGDSTTGFEVGDLDACGIKWKYQTAIKPNATTPTRFAFVTKAVSASNPLSNLGVGPVILAPKVGSNLEPFFINGPGDASTFSGSSGLADSVCQSINNFRLYFKKDSFGCTEDLYVCSYENKNCDMEGTQFLPDPPPYQDINLLTGPLCYKVPRQKLKMTLRNLNSGDFITPLDASNKPIPVFLKEIGFLGGRNSCGEGISVGLGSCTVTTQNPDGTFQTVTAYSYPTCPLPAAPTNLQVMQATTTQIGLRWTDMSTTEDGFKVERAPAGAQCSSCGSYSVIATLSNSSASYSAQTSRTVNYTNTGLTGNTPYCYRIKGYLRLGGGTTNGLGPALGPQCVTTAP